MKKTILLLCTVLLIAPRLMAQDSPVQELVDKYAGKKGVITVVVSKVMLQLFGDVSENKDSNAMSEALNNVRGLTIFKYSAKNDDNNIAEKIYKDIMSIIPIKKYKEIMNIRENGKKVSLLQRKEKGKANMLLIVDEGDEIILISLDGDIDVGAFSQIAKSLKVDALTGAEGKSDKDQEK